eukprot:TRINITY_DN1259_c0_g1_i28.p1 TRINITY_DN1259_c0_g1~~TRINITY_DN1259_c0_g1_i28.p1  ORF type:complete len:181 (+),score=40.78 TRINITY_DN1259_c0_g1_i28:234-776(+)
MKEVETDFKLFGEIKSLSFDRIKTCAILEYSTSDEARKALPNIHEQIRPFATYKLNAIIVDEDKANDILQKIKENERIELPNIGASTPAEALYQQSKIPPRKNVDRRNFEKKFAAKKEESPKNSLPELDKLFRKTITKPHLYYLPRSKEEVEKLRIKQSNTDSLKSVSYTHLTLPTIYSV